MQPPDHAADLPDWIVRQATGENDGPALLEGLCATLVKAGMPLWRVSIASPTIDPTVRGQSLDWRRGRPVTMVPTDHGSDGEKLFERSPIYTLLTENRLSARWRIEQAQGCDRYPLLAELRAEGGTDYALTLIGFSPGTALIGTAISIATDRPGGFTQEDIAAFDLVLPALGLAVYRLNLLRTATETLNTYLGPMTGGNVLAGQIQRGVGHTIPAAILMADLCGFTALADREDSARVVAWLNDHLDAIGDAVVQNGGEILKFLGDGLLAVFPIERRDAHPCVDCDRALLAAEQALARNDAVNAERRLSGGPTLELDVAVNFGDVVYGNVGTRRRLDFTTIGRAVNEASRIEKLCDDLGRHLLVSDTFARRCSRDLTSLGSFHLRGLDEPRQIWGVG